jgi:Apea-like HEPN
MIDHHFLIGWLIDRAQQVGASKTVEDLRRYLNTEVLEVTELLTFDGALTDEPLALKALQCMPWQKIADSSAKYSIVCSSVLNHRLPDAAITRTWSIPRAHNRPWGEQAAPQRTNFEDLHDAIRCVGLAVGAGTRTLNYWVEPPAWAPWACTPSTFGIDSTMVVPPLNVTDELGTVADHIYGRLTEMSDSQRERFRVPMDRLNKSRLAGIRFVDAAIELGISLESQFAPTQPPSGIGANIRLRAARLLALEPGARAVIRDAVKDSYDLRSRAVHSGRFDADRSNKWRDLARVHKAIEHGQKIAREALIRMLDLGEPDWDSFDLQ